jgi:hypothetical protein
VGIYHFGIPHPIHHTFFIKGEEIPAQYMQEAMAYLADFIDCGSRESKPGPKLLGE